ncbi:MAG: hypothetical protein KU38_06070 [Sulfurovum sp. FS08-3]|nr:MAG: hypothetical protein KU38_06070 [Sulfurovum sp. FS08-3]
MKKISLLAFVGAAMIATSCGGGSDSSDTNTSGSTTHTCESLIATKTNWTVELSCANGYNDVASMTIDPNGTYFGVDGDGETEEGTWSCVANQFIPNEEYEDAYSVKSNYFEFSRTLDNLTCTTKIF